MKYTRVYTIIVSVKNKQAQESEVQSMKNLVVKLHEVVEDRVMVSENAGWQKLMIAIETVAEKLGIECETFMMI